MTRDPSRTRTNPTPFEGGAHNADGTRWRGRARRARTALVSGVVALVACSGLAGLTGAVAPTPAGAVSPLTPGDLIVYRVGTGTGALGSASTAVFLDEYSPSGSLVESVPMPTATSGTNNPLTASGTATSEGQLSLSADGSSIVAAGYGSVPGTAGVATSPSATVHRTVAVVNSSGTVDTSTALTDFATGNNPRGVASTDGIHLWVSGPDASSGARYATLGGTTSTPLVSSTFKNFRSVQVVDGQLYASADPTKAGITVATVGTGTPTSGTNAVTNLPFSSAPTSPYAYSFLTLGTGTAPDTLYVADNGAGTVTKYGLSGGSWVKQGTVNVPNVLGITANDASGTVTIFATASAGTDGQLDVITDSSGFGGTLSGSPTTVASSTTNESFRGVAFAPGTVIGSGGGTPVTTPPTLTTADSSLEAALQDPTNPTLGVTVGDASFAADQLTVTASSSNPAVAASVAVSGTGASRTLTVTPGTTVGYSTITLTATAPDATSTTTTVTYGLSAYQGDPSQRYLTGVGNASTAIDVGGGYFLVADDLSNVIHLYQGGTSGTPVKSFDFTGVLPSGTTTIDMEAAARSGNTIYWLGSQSSSDSGNSRPAADTLFATTVSGSGASTSLTYVGSDTGLRQDLINWDAANGSPLNFSADSQGSSKTVNGFNIEGLEFAPGSTSTAYLAFRAPLENSSNPTDALLVPVTNIDSLVTAGNPGSTTASFGAPIEWNLGGLGIREIRKNSDNQYLVIAGTSDGTDSPFGLYTWDGNPSDAPSESPTSADLAPVADGAWESIVAVPDPLVAGAPITLLEDNGDTAWYGDTATSKAGLPSGLQKDLEQTFTYETPTSVPGSPTALSATAAVDGSRSLSVTWSPPADDGGAVVSSYTVTATPEGVGAPLDATFSGSATVGTVTGLTNGTAYDVSVTATNSIGTGAPAAVPGGPFTPSGPADAPTGVVATAGNGSATVSWTAPADEGAPITGYTVSDGFGDTCATATTSCIVTGLTNGTAYAFTVTATNADGTSDPSAASTAVVPTSVPDTPTGVVAVAGNGEATITWTAPSSEGASITGYIVSASNSNPTKTCVTTGARTCVISGLANGASYFFTVQATNADGTGTASTPSNTVVPTSNTAAITSADSATVVAGKTLHVKVAASGTPKPTLSASGLPAGVSFKAAAGGKGTLTGSPTAGPGTYHLTLTADNGTGPGADQAFTLVVFAFSSSTTANFTVGTAGTFAVTTAPALAGTTVKAKLPTKLAGLTFAAGPDGTATISGTPRAGDKSKTVTITAESGRVLVRLKVQVTITG